MIYHHEKKIVFRLFRMQNFVSTCKTKFIIRYHFFWYNHTYNLTHKSTGKRLNIVFILVDNVGWGSLAHRLSAESAGYWPWANRLQLIGNYGFNYKVIQNFKLNTFEINLVFKTNALSGNKSQKNKIVMN